MITLRLDKNGGINKGDIKAFEHDNLSEVYVIQLYKNGAIYDLTNKTVELTIVEKKRKLGDMISLPIYEAIEGKVKLEVVSAITKQDGIFDFKLTVKDTTGLIETFPNFQVKIENDITDSITGEIIQDQNFTILVDGLKALADYNIYKTNALKVPEIEKDIVDLTSQLDTIANKGTTVEVLERVTKEEIDRQIEDGTIANLTIADGSITEEKLDIENPVRSMVNLGNKGTNIINKNDLISDVGYYNENMKFIIHGQNRTTNYILVKPSTMYSMRLNTNLNVLFFDINKKYIRGESIYSKWNFTTPAECFFIMFSASVTNFNSETIIEGEVKAPSYIEYVNTKKIILGDEFFIRPTKNKLKNDAIENFTFTKRNMFDKNNIIKDGYYNQYGEKIYDGVRRSSDFIEIQANAKYNVTAPIRFIYAYDEAYSYISTVTVSYNIFTTPTSSKYIVVVFDNTEIDNIGVYEGEVIPSVNVSYNTEDYYLIDNKKVKYEINEKEKEFRHDTNDYKANATIPLYIETDFDGSDQPTHPSVITFSSAWNGYKYWLTCTPYPYTIANLENPNILASNDLIKWEVPNGLINPIALPHETQIGSGDFLSDCELIYRSDLDRLECWYRFVTGNQDREVIYRKISSDGINWSEPEKLQTFNTNITAITCTSPTVIYDYDINKYRIWYCKSEKKGFAGYVRYAESVDGTNWEDKGYILINNRKVQSWHICVRKNKIGYEMICNVNTTMNSVYKDYGWTLDYLFSEDGITWTEPRTIMTNRKQKGFIDSSGIYRACLIRNEKNVPYIFYGVIDDYNHWRISLSIGTNENINSLKGINGDMLPYMSQCKRKPRFGYEGQELFDRTLNKKVICIKGGNPSTWVDMNGNRV